MAKFLKIIIPIMVLVIGITAGLAVLAHISGKGTEAVDDGLYYTVTFNTGKEGKKIQPMHVAFNERPTLPKAESNGSCAWYNMRTGETTDEPLYDFLGWYTSDGQEVTSATFSHNQNVTVYAKWKANVSEPVPIRR